MTGWSGENLLSTKHLEIEDFYSMNPSVKSDALEWPLADSQLRYKRKSANSHKVVIIPSTGKERYISQDISSIFKHAFEQRNCYV